MKPKLKGLIGRFAHRRAALLVFAVAMMISMRSWATLATDSASNALSYQFAEDQNATDKLAGTSVKDCPPVAYIDENGNERTNDDYTIVTEDFGRRLGDIYFFDSGWYVVTGNLSRCQITVEGDVNFILCDEAKLTVTGSMGFAGICVTNNNSFTVYGQAKGTGELEAFGGPMITKGMPGIGSYDGRGCGTVTINGGIVKAYGTANAAGIGGQRNVAGGAVVINGGKVTAVGNGDGAGIGCGKSDKNPPVHDHGTLTVREGMVVKAGANAESAAMVSAPYIGHGAYYYVEVPPTCRFDLRNSPEHGTAMWYYEHDSSVTNQFEGSFQAFSNSTVCVLFRADAGYLIKQGASFYEQMGPYSFALTADDSLSLAGCTCVQPNCCDLVTDGGTTTNVQPSVAYALKAAKDGDLILMREDFEQSDVLEFDHSVTLDCRGHGFTVNDSLTIKDGVSVVLENSVPEDGGYVFDQYARFNIKAGGCLDASFAYPDVSPNQLMYQNPGLFNSFLSSSIAIKPYGAMIVTGTGTYTFEDDGTIGRWKIDGEVVKEDFYCDGDIVAHESYASIEDLLANPAPEGLKNRVALQCAVTISSDVELDLNGHCIYGMEHVITIDGCKVVLSDSSDKGYLAMEPVILPGGTLEITGGSYGFEPSAYIDTDRLVVVEFLYDDFPWTVYPKTAIPDGMYIDGTLAKRYITVSYIDENGVERSTNVCRAVTADTTEFVDDCWYVVASDVARESGITVSGSAHLILCNDRKLSVDGGIDVSVKSSVTNALSVYGQRGDTGELKAGRNFDDAAIGGVDSRVCGIVTINGGKVTATSKGGAGIGSGQGVSKGGTVIINGGIVYASSNRGAGIGGGGGGNPGCSGGTVVINGGMVTAIGGEGSAGIGGSFPTVWSTTEKSNAGDGGSITINGGTVTAMGGENGAGIGGGYDTVGGAGGTVTITGGNVTATGGKNAAGIGGGGGIGPGGAGGTVTITGGHVTATGGMVGAYGAPGIGAGANGTDQGSLTVGDNVLVKAGNADPPTTVKPHGENGEITLAKERYYQLFMPSAEIVSAHQLWPWNGKIWATVDVSYLDPTRTYALKLRLLDIVDGGAATNVYTYATAWSNLTGKTGAYGTVRIDAKSASEEGAVPPAKIFENPPLLVPVLVEASAEYAGKVFAGLPRLDTRDEITAFLGETLELTYSSTAFGEDYSGNTVSVTANGDELSVKGSESFNFKWTPVEAGTYKFAHTPGDLSATVHVLGPVDYLDWDDVTKTMTNAVCRMYETVTAATAAFEDGTWYVVTNGANVGRGTIKVNGSAHLILCDGGRLAVVGHGSDSAGVEVTDGRALTVYGQEAGTGELFAQGASFTGSGIGGSGLIAGDGHDCGMVTVNGGTVTAIGGQCGAGIGGAYQGAGGAVTINGGTVTATGGQLAPGIGAGKEGTLDGTLSLATGLGVIVGADRDSAELLEPTEPGKGAYYRTTPLCTITVGTPEHGTAAWVDAAKPGVTNDVAGGKFAVAAGHSVTLLAIAAEGYYIKSNGDAFTTLPIDLGEVTASCAEKLPIFWTLPTITYTVNHEGAGAVTGVARSLPKETITVVATANVNWDFVNWSGEDEEGSGLGIGDSSEPVATFTAKFTNMIVTANFKVSGTYRNTQAAALGDAYAADLGYLESILAGGGLAAKQAEVEAAYENGVQKINDAENDTPDKVDEVYEDAVKAMQKVLDDITLVSVTFNALGGTFADGTDQTIIDCEATCGYSLPPAVERTGYRLDGWYTSWQAGATKVETGQLLQQAVRHTLYAKWTTEGTSVPAAHLVIPDRVGNDPEGAPTLEIADAAYAAAYYKERAITEVTTPTFLTRIGENAFNGVSTLTTLDLRPSYRYDDPTKLADLVICRGAFAGTGLTRVVLPQNVVEIGKYAFQNCRKLSEVVILGKPATIGLAPFAQCGLDVGGVKVRICPDLAGDADYMNRLLQSCPNVTVDTHDIPYAVSIGAPVVDGNGKCSFTVNVETMTKWNNVNVSSVRIEYKASLDDASWTPLAKESSTVNPDGSVTVVATSPGGTSGFFRAVISN